MLLKLLTEQLDKFWPFVKFALEQSVPPEVLARTPYLNNTLKALLTGDMQCWISTEDMDSVLACVLTALFEDKSVGEKRLRIVLVYGYDKVPQSEWAPGLETLTKFAKSLGCTTIEAFTDNMHIDSIAHKVGFKSDIHLWKEI